jgi:hypothetical protein
VSAGVRLPGGLELRISDEPAVVAPGGDPVYPTRRLQRGLLLLCDGQDVSGEGVGFGVPVLKCGLQTVFPGGMELTLTGRGRDWQATAAYRMDLVERLTGREGGVVRPRLVYAAKDSLAAVHRRVPALRGPLSATSVAVRRRLGWKTSYEPAGLVATVPVTYTVRDGESLVSVAADLTGVPQGVVTEIAVMNELGAGHFDRYEDSSGAALRGAAVGTWDAVVAGKASFVSSRRRLAFSLEQVRGARLLRGREVVAGRLAWAGFGYLLRPGTPRLEYDVRIDRRADRHSR